MRRASSSRWVAVVGLSILGIVVLWWASEQLEEARTISGSTFDIPEWRILGWLLTLVTAGAVFGIAAGFARDGFHKANVAATLVVGVLPFSVVAYYWIYFFGWLPGIRWLSEPTVIASCMVVGFLAGGLVLHWLSPSESG